MAIWRRTKWGKKKQKVTILPKVKVEGENITLSGPFSTREIAKIFNCARFDTVEFRDLRLIDKKVAAEIGTVEKIRNLHVASRVTRPALSVLMQIRGLEEVYFHDFAGAGRLRDFNKAKDVDFFRTYYTLKSADFIEISKLPKLQKLCAHCSEIGVRALDNIQAMPSLREVDFEAILFTDELAKILAKSTSITDIRLPATQLSTTGLKYISQMPQLRYIDIWANGFAADDLDLLIGHPSLEALEIGSMGRESPSRLKAVDVILKLEKMPGLKEVYFQNVDTTEEEYAYLNSRYKFRLLNG